jgi:hypothetical protein
VLVVRVEGRDRRAEASVSSRRACPTATRRRERDHHAHDERPDPGRPHGELEGPPSARPRKAATAAPSAWIGFVPEETSRLYVSRARFSRTRPDFVATAHRVGRHGGSVAPIRSLRPRSPIPALWGHAGASYRDPGSRPPLNSRGHERISSLPKDHNIARPEVRGPGASRVPRSSSMVS